MKKLLNFIFLSIFATIIEGQVHYSGECPNIIELAQLDFDQEKFAGNWYEIQATLQMNPIEAAQKCVRVWYSYEKYGSVQVIIETIGRITQSETYKEETFIPKRPGVYVSESGFSYALVATDYDTYAVIAGCKNLKPGFLGHLGTIAVLGRKKSFTPDEQNAVDAVMAKANMKVDNLRYTIQDCDDE